MKNILFLLVLIVLQVTQATLIIENKANYFIRRSFADSPKKNGNNQYDTIKRFTLLKEDLFNKIKNFKDKLSKYFSLNTPTFGIKTFWRKQQWHVKYGKRSNRDFLEFLL